MPTTTFPSGTFRPTQNTDPSMPWWEWLPLLIVAILALVLAPGCGDDGGSTTQDTTQPDQTDATDATDQIEADTTPDQTDDIPELCDADLADAILAGASTSTGTVASVPAATEGFFDTTITVPWNESAAPWLYVRLLEGTAVPLTDDEARTSALWDLAVKGSTLRLNGGVSGPGNVEATALNGVALAAVTDTTPLGDFRVDEITATCAAPADVAAALQTAIGQWWTASSTAEVPVAALKVYVVRRTDGDLIKIQITQATVASGQLTLNVSWGPLAPIGPVCDVQAVLEEGLIPINTVSTGAITVTPGTPNVAVVDATAGGFSNQYSNPYVYLDLDAGAKVAITDVQAFTDTTWDIAFKRAAIRTNGGDSGAGGVSVAEVSAASLDAVTTMPPTNAFMTDQLVDRELCTYLTDPIGYPAGAMAGWYNYDVNAHTTTPFPLVYVIETTEGAFVKFRVSNYSNATLTVEWAPMP